MNKRITVQQVRDTVRLAKKAKLDIYLDFMIAYPGEDETDIIKTIDFAKELNPDYAQISITVLMRERRSTKMP